MPRFSHERPTTLSALRTVSFAWVAAAAIGFLLQLDGAGAESPGTLYLHGTGDIANPSILFLDTAAPAAGTAKYNNSAAISFQGGNKWRELGSWTSASTVTAAPNVASVDIWVGLKGFDDLTAAYDFQAIVTQNNKVVDSGQTLCVDGFSPNPASAKRVTISLTSAAQPASGTPITLTLSARIGTNASGGRCRAPRPEPSAGTGIRVYFDSADRASAINAVPTAPVNSAPVVSAGSNQTVTLPSTASLSGSVTDDGLPAGATVTSMWSQVSGPGVVFADAGQASTTATFAEAGTFVLRLTASDSVLSASADVTITVKPATSNNRPPSFTSSPDTNAKHQIAYSYQAAASDPDGDPLTFSLGSAPSGMTIGASGLVQWTPTGSQIGRQPVSLVVTDSKNASATQSFEIEVVDATAPVLTLSMPSEALPGTSVTATALANDNIGVTSVTFELNGGDAQDDTATPFQRTIAVPGTAVAGTEFHVHATARDGAGNVAEADRTFKVAAVPDTQPPTLTLNVPAEAAAGTTVRLTAAAADATGVKSVTFKRDASVLVADSEAPFEASYTVPADAPVSSSIAFTARALDFADNFTDASGSLVVAAAPDQIPPTVQLIAPAQIEEGGVLALAATATDNVGVASVTFHVNGVEVGTSTMAPYSAMFKLPASAKGGDSLHVEARAIDFAGLDARSVHDTQIIASPNRAPTASAGGPYSGQAGDRIQFSASASSDPDAGDVLTYDWDFGDGTRGSGVAPRHAYASAGSFTATVTVNDSRDGTSTAQAAVAITAATDHTPPHVTLNGPSAVVPGSQVTITAQASDDQGVTSVIFKVNAADPTETSTVPYQRTITVPAVASPGDQISVRATARDAAGNLASADLVLTISAVPDTQNPTITLNAPPQAAAGNTVHLSATANDNVGVQSVAFSVNGQVITTRAAPPFEANYPIPADAPANSSLGITVRAADFNGNTADASGVVSIAAPSAADITPPTITLSAPLQVIAGKTLGLSAIAADNVGVAGVSFFVDGVNVATSTAAPYGFTLTLGSAYTAGAVLHLSARAMDFSGLEASATAQTLIVSSSSAGQGILAGEAYDDAIGLPLAGVTAALTGTDASGAPYTQTAITDARGRWVLHATEGQGIVRLSKAGWTRVDRKASIATDQALELIDARLTAEAGDAGELSAVLGGTLQTGTSTLTVPPGALQEPAGLRLTNVSQQGLEGVLPAGWSPLAAADITPHGVSFSGGATLSLSALTDVPAGTPLVVGTWDEEAAVWRAIGELIASGGASMLETTVPASGQYAFLIPDLLPNPPPATVVGEEISGVGAAALAANTQTVIDPQPKILFYSPGVRSDVRGTITAPASPTSSGAIAEARITESYTFLNGTKLNPEPFVEDFFFFQIGAPEAGVTAGFAVTPSQTFDPFALQSGVISVELLAPDATDVVPTIGANGGTATSATGEALIVPQGALTESLPLVIRGLTPESLGISLPSALTLAGSAQVDFSGSFAKPAALSVAKPTSITDASRLLLVRVQAVGGETRLVLVGRGTIAGNRITSDTSLEGTPDAFEGIRIGGRYLFVQAAGPIGFAKGSVLAAGGGAFSGALVSTPSLSIVALSATTGGYVAASGTGAVTLTALDLQTSDTATGTSTIPSPGGVVPLNLQLVASVPRVTAITPADGATSVPLSSPIVVRFSKSIVPSSVNATTLTLAAADGSVVPSAITFSSNDTIATLRPSAALASNATYAVSVTDSIVDASGRHLASAVSAHFTSLDTSPPPAPPAGSVQASIPNAQGVTTVSATQGTAGVHDTVAVVNVTRNTSTPVLVEANGGFSVLVAATLTDRLQIVITSQNGRQTVVPLGAFRQTNADGSVSAAVGAEGGLVEGPGGTAVEVPADAFPAGAIITLKKLTEVQFPVQLDAAGKELLSFSSGVQLDLGGETPEKYLNVFVPATAADTSTDQWLVSRARDNNGVPVLDIVDTAKLIDGRIRTSSPPCPGVTGAGVYGVYKSTQPVGVSYAHMSSSGYGGLQMTATMLLTTGALVPLPWFVLEPVTAGPVCYPVLTGRITVSANTQTLTIPASQLTQADREIVVRNTTRNSEAHFPRNVLEFIFEVAGGPADSFAVVVRDANGSDTAVTSIDVTDAGAGKVKVRLDADRIPVSVAAVTITNVTTNATTSFPQAQVTVKLAVAGGAGDAYQVTAIDAAGQARSITIGPVLSPTGPGNMVARAVTGTIDPTRAEIDAYNAQHPEAPITGAGRTKVLLKNLTQPTSIEIPASAIANGGFTYTFDGGLTDRYRVEVSYEDGKQVSIDISTFRITVQNRTTGREIRTITLPAPPRDEPLNLGVISDDNQRPSLTSGPTRLTNFDTGGLLTFKFSEAMDAASLKAGIIVERVRNGQRTRVEGEFRVSNGNTVVTFVPKFALGVGEEYSITFVGDDALGQLLVPDGTPVTDVSGNSLSTTRFRITTFKPRPVGIYTAGVDSSGDQIEFKDVEIRRKKVNDTSKTYLVATADSRIGYRLATFDVTDPTNPVQLHTAAGGSGKKRLTLLPDIGTPEHPAMALREATVTCAGTPTSTPISSPFKGDLAIATSWNTYYSYLSFYDVSNPENPCLLANKLLTAAPDTLTPFSQKGTVHALGYARGVATIQHSQGYAAYAAVGEVGLFAADIGKDIPEYGPDDRTKEGIYSGDYYDVVNVSDRLLAANRGDSRLDLFDPNLTLLGSIELPAAPRRIVTVSGYGVDRNDDGLLTPDEQFDLALVAVDEPGTGVSRIEIVDITSVDDMRVVGEISMPGITRDLAVDPERRRIFASGAGQAATGTGTDALFMIDLSNPFGSGSSDADDDGLDDRILWQHTYATSLNGIRLDSNRGLLYVASGKGLDIWAVYDACCDLVVDLTARAPERQSGDKAALLAKEKKALQQEIAAGLQSASTTCNTPLSSISILEQGSGACLWKSNPLKACSDSYQPGLSDHDYEVLFPAAVAVSVQSCTVAELSKRFIEPETGTPKKIVLDDGSTITFEDVTFFPFRREDFESGKLNVLPPQSSGGDATGDLGLGRQQLLLLWLLGGEYVPLPQLPDVAPGRSLDAILQDLTARIGIQRLEGFEWSSLQSFNLAKSKARLRLKGASDPASALHAIYVKQLHDAAKAGIRAAFARFVADGTGNSLATRVTRESYVTNACLGVNQAVTNPNRWFEKPCTSFEEYAASVIARTLRGPVPLPIFTLDEVFKIHRFYRVKADIEHIISEADADAFVASVWQFVEQSKAITQPIYQQQIGTAPDAAQRTANLSTAETKREAALKTARIALPAHVFNRGFRAAEQVALAMYRADAAGSGQLVKSIRVDLAGGDDRILSFERNADGSLKLDEGNQAIPVFELGPIDLTTDLRTPRGVSFTIDLPEHKVQEAVRENNLGGFFYYSLDVQNPTVPATPATPHLPFADPSVLDPSPECDDVPALTILQRILTSDGQRLDIAELGLGETVTIELVVSNRSAEAQHGVTVCSNITNQCYDAGTLAVGETRTIAVQYTVPATGQYIDGAPSAYSTEAGIMSGPATRLIANCESYLVVPLAKDPNPDVSEAMIGGRALRYYKVVSRRTGTPKPNATIAFELTGFFGAGEGTRHFTLKTDAEGRIFDPANPGRPNAIPGLPIPATSDMVVGSVYFGTIRSVDGIQTACSQPLTFEFQPADREFSRSYTQGASIEGSAGIFLTGELGAEAGVEIEKQETYRSGAKTLNLTTTEQLSGKLGVEFALVEFKTGIGVGRFEVGAEAGVSTTRLTGWSETHSFEYPLDATKNCAIATILLERLVGVNPLLVKLLDLVRTNPCSDPTAYLQSRSRLFGREAEATANVSISASQAYPKSQPAPDDKHLKASFGADGSSGFGLEVNYETGYDIPNRGLADPASRTEEYTLKGGLNFEAGIEVEPTADPPKDDEEEDEDETTVELLKRSLETSISADLAETYSVSFSHDFTKPQPGDGYPTAVDISYSPPKGFGWKRTVAGLDENLVGGLGRTLTYTVENPDDVKKVVDGLANLDAIRKANVGAGVLNQITLAPTLLNEELARFRGLLREINATYTLTESKGQGNEVPLSVEGKLGPFKLGGGIALKADHSVSYTIEKGLVVNGATYALEKYTKDEFVPNQDLGLRDAVTTTWNALINSFAAQHFSDVTQTVGTSSTTRLRSNFTATIDIDGTKEPAPFEAGLFSWRFRPIDGPVQDAHYLPSDTAGPRGNPHYGIGSFHQFTPDGYQLAVPTPLIIDYTDDEVTGIDEASLRIYGWNAAANDWDLVGGVVDSTANTVTAPVSTFRQYTLAPAMPARNVPLSANDDGPSGGGDSAIQRFTVTSGPLVMNNGQPVPDGTLFTVRTLVPSASDVTPYGTIRTADEDPARSEVQVASQNGVIQFQVEYPAPNGIYIPGRLVVYSTKGTAFGQTVAVKQ